LINTNWHYFEPRFEFLPDLITHESAWEGHKFFAYDLVANLKPGFIVELGTHYGTSFFSFCQAVKDKNINSTLYAVDSWKGDPHASFYGNEVYDTVTSIVNRYYSNLQVHLLKMNFDDAIEQFEDGSIDLLHIDGYHTYEAVKHDFDLWVNKTSENGIIIFHDTAEKIGDFGVYKLWDEIKRRYNTLEFFHYHGLGIVIKRSDLFDNIFSLQEVWQKYYPLLMDMNTLKNNVEHLNNENSIKSSFLEQNRHEITLLNQTVQLNSLENSKLNQSIGQYASEQNILKQTINENINEIGLLNNQIHEKDNSISIFNQTIAEKDHEVFSLNSFIKEKDREISSLNTFIEEKDHEISSLSSLLAEKENEINFLKDSHATSNQLKDQEISQLSDINRIRDTEILVLSQNHEQEHRESATRQTLINSIYSSWSWKLTQPLRWGGDRFNKLNFSNLEIRNIENEITLISYKIALLVTRLTNHFAPALSDNILSIFKSVNLIRKSNLFDQEYYFRTYPEVKNQKIDPILHYLVYGAKEGRNPSLKFITNLYSDNYPDIKYLGINPLIHFILTGDHVNEGFAESEIPADSSNTADISHTLTDSEISTIASRISESIHYNLFILSISHTDYLTNVGGVEVFMQDERTTLAENGVSYLQLSPVKKQRLLADAIDVFYLSFNVDSTNFGTFSANDLIRLFSKLQADKKLTCNSIVLHHLMSWNLDVIKLIITLLTPKKVIFWIHDFYTVCPQINLLRNDKVFCNAPESDSNSCMICHYGSMRKNNLPKIKAFFDSITFTVMAPSQVALNLWGKEFHLNLADSHIVPHVNLIPINSVSRNNTSDNILNVAFVGIPASHKGWKTWRKLVDRNIKSSNYRFFHFGNDGGKFPEKFIKVNVTQNTRDDMINALRSNSIDLLFHWAICPETFSYTLYEGIAANCFILTFKNSGNVAKYVLDTGSGVVFDEEQQLFHFMDDVLSVRKELKGYLQRNSGPFQLERNNVVSIRYYS